MDRGAWRATAHGVEKNQTLRLTDSEPTGTESCGVFQRENARKCHLL